ncbi:MAG: hypothetical protein GY865_17855, partial [candidate division Zixibacteria bacterium]|nr:hypothetical protein [candidate division Zixibacteria bacterium]
MILYSLKNSFIFLVTILILLLACKPQSDLDYKSKNSPAPEAIIFKQSFDGIILGKKISEPFGLTSDMAGNLYLVDAGNNRIVWFDRDL